MGPEFYGVKCIIEGPLAFNDLNPENPDEEPQVIVVFRDNFTPEAMAFMSI